MRKLYIISFLGLACFACISFGFKKSEKKYVTYYTEKLAAFSAHQKAFLKIIEKSELQTVADKDAIRERLNDVRNDMKAMDFWLRYLDPVQYKNVNGPLPVEWETDASARLKKPSRRDGAGFTLADLYLDKGEIRKDKLLQLIQSSINACTAFNADSITEKLQTHHHFYLCNRLYLLNLASIYTTGFECPDTARVIPELIVLMENTGNTYLYFNRDFSRTSLSADYMLLYKNAIDFVRRQPVNYSQFDHFTFIRDYVNPLFAFNQNLIKQYSVVSNSSFDFTLNNYNTSIFNKALFNGQDPKGIYATVDDPAVLQEIDRLGKLLFYDPVLSKNNLRSCNSCHKSKEYFTDTAVATSLQINGKDHLPRNAPTLINAQFNQLVMVDGKHISLQNQLRDVVTNPLEMGSTEKDILNKVISCKEYKAAFTRLLAYTPQQPAISIDHIVSAITFYYTKFSKFYAPFDNAMNEKRNMGMNAELGFNVFMSKAQCATCHFVPQFNGVKPPYITSEFEVLGVPADKNYAHLSSDEGRYTINPADETLHAMRTGTIRNAAHTKPYMHNGVFSTLNEVIDFYDTGGGAGHGLKVPNQTLSPFLLCLTQTEKIALVSFINSLNEDITFEQAPAQLPLSDIADLNKRKVGGSR